MTIGQDGTSSMYRFETELSDVAASAVVDMSDVGSESLAVDRSFRFLCSLAWDAAAASAFVRVAVDENPVSNEPEFLR